MVLEVSTDGEYKAIAAKPPPTLLHNAIMNARCLSLKQLLNEALTPAQRFSMTPTQYPMACVLESADGKANKGVAQYPLGIWRQQNEPCITVVSWLELGLVIAGMGGNAPEASKLMDIAKKLKAAPEGMRDASEKSLDKWWLNNMQIQVVAKSGGGEIRIISHRLRHGG